MVEDDGVLDTGVFWIARKESILEICMTMTVVCFDKIFVVFLLMLREARVDYS